MGPRSASARIRIRRRTATRGQRTAAAHEATAASGLPALDDWVVLAALAVAVRPWLWGTALRQLAVLAAPGWWRRRPWLPLPDPAYLRFRLITQYGDGGHAPDPGDVVTYLHWCRSYRAALR